MSAPSIRMNPDDPQYRKYFPHVGDQFFRLHPNTTDGSGRLLMIASVAIDDNRVILGITINEHTSEYVTVPFLGAEWINLVDQLERDGYVFSRSTFHKWAGETLDCLSAWITCEYTPPSSDAFRISVEEAERRLLAKQGVPASRWNSKVPTEAGWYWQRRVPPRKYDAPEIVHIRKFGSGLAVGNTELRSWADLKCYQWCGPLEEPK